MLEQIVKQTAFILILTSTLFSCADEDQLKVVGNLQWDRLELTAESAEPLVEILKQEGQKVSAGEIILRLDSQRAQALLDEAIAISDQARAKLAEMVRGTRDEKITEVRARLTGAESEAKNAEKELLRQQTLVKQQMVSSETLDSAKAQRDSAVANRNAISAELKAFIKGSTIEELDQVRASLAQADAHVRVLEVNLARLTVTAPQDGWLDNLPYKLGEKPKVGAVIAVMLAGQSPYARVYVPEPLRAKISSTTEATVYIDGIDTPFKGHLRLLSKDPVFTPYYSLTEHDRSRLSYLAEVELDDKGDYLLFSGLPLEVIFSTGSH